MRMSSLITTLNPMAETTNPARTSHQPDGQCSQKQAHGAFCTTADSSVSSVIPQRIPGSNDGSRQRPIAAVAS
jgi:hypothetical protein